MCEKIGNKLNGLKDTLKDAKNLDEIDFENLDQVRGKTPADIKQKCLKLCKEYLAGNWIQQTIQTINVRRINGGMTNQLYYCGIISPLNTTKIPQEVAIRFYGEKYINKFDFESNKRLTDVVIALLVSESGLGPKIYGLFEEGQIQHFYKHRQFKVEEQQNEELVTEVFQKLARVHAMNVPIKKCHWLFREFDNFYGQAEKNMERELNEVIKELNCQTLLKHNFKDEINWIKDLIVKSKSPMTFTHNDFRSSNIMILEDRDNNNTEEQIVLCDFEYSSYGYRGLDFGTIIGEWGRSWSDFKDLHQFPDDSIIKPLIDIYIKESEKIFGKSYSENSLNSMEQILKEVKVFVLSETLFLILWCLNDEDNIKEAFPMDVKVKTEMMKSSLNNYWHLKQQFLQQNAFNF